MRRILVVHYSQTGQLDRVVGAICGPLQDQEHIRVDALAVRPQTPYPFPWPFLRFFSIFPETVAMRPEALMPMAVDESSRYDLVILAYQVWFLAPSRPMSSFLASPLAARVLADTPVVTVIGCRNMWLMAQEKVKQELQRLGARLVDNVALVDACGGFASFIATPLWMFTGKRQPFAWLPAAGIGEDDIRSAGRFGAAIRDRLARPEPITQPMLAGLGAVRVDEKLIASERVGTRSFFLWGRLLSRLGGPDSGLRRAGMVVYIVFLLILIVTVVPVTALLKKVFSPLFRARIQRQKAYFAGPSGE